MTRRFFHMAKGKQTAKGVCFINGQQPNSQEHEDCSWCQRRKTRLLWPMWPSTEHILKDIRASSSRCSLKFFGRPSSSSLPCLPSQPMTARVILELHCKCNICTSCVLCFPATSWLWYRCRTNKVTYPTWNWKLNSLFLFVFWCVLWFRRWLLGGFLIFLQT